VKLLFLIIGSFSLMLGLIGIIIPGLPTTPFVLLAGYLYFKSSDKLYNWLLNQKYLGKYLRDYKSKKAFSKKTMIVAIILMWVMISSSIFLFISEMNIRIIVICVGIIGTVVMLSVKTYTKKNDNK